MPATSTTATAPLEAVPPIELWPSLTTAALSRATNPAQAELGVSGLVPSVDGSSPGINGLTPGIDGLAPGMHGPTPGFNGPTPGTDGLAPGSHGTIPGSHGTMPGSHGTMPGSHGTMPGSHGLPPGSLGLTRYFHDQAPALADGNTPMQPAPPLPLPLSLPLPRSADAPLPLPLSLPLPRSADAPPPPGGATANLALSTAGSPGIAPPALAELALLSSWRTLSHLASLHPPAICLCSLTPPG